jgi:hypothetical protein
MGARNAKAALAAWGDRLPATPMLVLLAMALTAHDDDHPRYWGGRAKLLGALGRDPESRADQKSLERALRTLVDVGAVTLLNRPRVGVRARYRNILEPSLTLRLQVGAKVSKLGRRTGATSPRPGQGKNHKIRRTVTKNAPTRRHQPSPASQSGSTSSHPKPKAMATVSTPDVVWVVEGGEHPYHCPRCRSSLDLVLRSDRRWQEECPRCASG